MRPTLLAAALVMACAGPVLAQPKTPDLKGKSYAEYLNDLLPGMGEKDPGKRFQPQQQWQAVCTAASAPGNEKMRKDVCLVMSAKLGADVPEQARVALLKQLEFLGRDECVSAVAKAIDDPSDLVRDGAIRALANNPANDATDFLIDKLAAAKGKARIAIINALGYRKAPTAVLVLAKEFTGEPAAAQAAARALGKIADQKAAEQLAKARAATTKEPIRSAICDAYLSCADQLAKDGKTAEAAAIYKDLYDNETLRPIRMAALEGSLKTAGDAAGTRIAELIIAKDKDAREIAVAEIASISTKALESLAAASEKLPVPAQVQVLTALAARAEKSQLAVALKAAESSDDTLKRHGLLAIGRLGDASVVPSLADTALGPGKHAPFARESLINVTGPGVDEKIIAIFKSDKDPGRRAALIQVLELRRAAIATPVLLEEACGEEAGPRAAACRALAKLAEPKDIPALVPAVLKAAAGKERTDAEIAVVAVVGRIDMADKRPDALLAVVTPQTQTDLLPLLGRVGGPKVLAIAKESLGIATANKAAIVALCNWPDHTVSEELLTIAKTAPDAGDKKLAFKSLVRINSISNEPPAPPRLIALKKAMDLAENDAEKKLVIDALATVKDVETLRFVIPYLDDKALQQPACKTIVELAHSKMLREPNQAEFVRALDRVIMLCKDASLVDRAKKYKAGG